MVQRYQMLIGDGLCEARSGKWLESVNPATEEAFALFPAADADDVDRAVRMARAAAPVWASTEISERAVYLRRIAAAIRAQASDLALLETRDAGKPIRDTESLDVPDAAAAFDYFATAAAQLYGTTIPVRNGMLDYTARSPVGVVGQIAPWNFPIVNAAWKIAPAIALGNTVVFKPSELAPLTALRLGEICIEAGLPPGVVNVVSGTGSVAGAALVSHPGVDKISFTGSTATGRAIQQAAAVRLLPATLELGGKSANIVFEDADLDAAAAGVAFGIFFNAGQVCTAGSRLLVDAKVRKPLLDRLIRLTANIRVGPPEDPVTRIGPLISQQQRAKVREYIAGGDAEGALRLHEGTVPGGPGYYVPPIIFSDVRSDMRIAREEIFGPVLSVLTFSGEDEAVAIANDTRYGLAAGIWSSNLGRAHRVASRLNCGSVWVNTYNFVTPQTPAPARGESGIGVELGLEGLEEYTHLKNIVIDYTGTPLDFFL